MHIEWIVPFEKSCRRVSDACVPERMCSVQWLRRRKGEKIFALSRPILFLRVQKSDLFRLSLASVVWSLLQSAKSRLVQAIP